MNETNYATSFKLTKIPQAQFTCLNCYKTWYVQKILGNDNTWRVLPHWCRFCDYSTKLTDIVHLQKTLAEEDTEKFK